MVSLWNKIPIKCLFVRELNIYIGFWSLRWRPLNMGFVDKGPSKSAMVFLLFVLSISQAWWASNFDEHQKILNMMASWLRNVGPMRFGTSFIAAPTRCQCQTLVVLVNLFACTSSPTRLLLLHWIRRRPINNPFTCRPSKLDMHPTTWTHKAHVTIGVLLTVFRTTWRLVKWPRPLLLVR